MWSDQEFIIERGAPLSFMNFWPDDMMLRLQGVAIIAICLE